MSSTAVARLLDGQQCRRASWWTITAALGEIPAASGGNDGVPERMAINVNTP